MRSGGRLRRWVALGLEICRFEAVDADSIVFPSLVDHEELVSAPYDRIGAFVGRLKRLPHGIIPYENV